VSDNHNFDDDEFFEEEYVPTLNRWKLLGTALAVVIVTGFGIGIWYAYDQGVKKGVQLAPPIIKADTRPVKEKPKDPGGMDIPHQDKKVFDVLVADKEEEKVEKLMAAPEEVVQEPAPVDIPETKTDAMAKGADKAETLMAKPVTKAEEKVAQLVTKPKAPKIAEVIKTPEVTEPASATKKIEPVIVQEKAKVITAPVKAAATSGPRYRVQLGAFRSSDAAEKAWLDLEKKHEELLGGIVHKVQSIEIKGKGIFHRLQAGVFEQKTAASGLCTKLKAQKQDCLIAKS